MAVGLQHNHAELATIAPRRRILYLFLSEAFAEPPTANSLSILQNEEFQAATSLLLGRDAMLPLLSCGKDVPVSPTPQEDLRRTFMNLFKVPGPEYVAPYESVFRDTREIDGQSVRGLLMGLSAVDVQRCYRLAAVDLTEEYHDLPDHIALELNFLAHLCGKEEAFLANGDEARLIRTWEMERDFLSAHVVSWVPKLRDGIHEKCRHSYFRSVADLAVEFTRRDLLTVESVIGPRRHEGPTHLREKVSM